MAIRLMTAVWDDESLPRGDVLLMLALADHANDDGACFPSINRLARRTRSSPSTVRRHLRSLRDAGRLVVDPREGTSNVYRIVMRGDGWQYGPSHFDTPSNLPPLSAGGRGTPSTAVAGGAVTATTPEPSLSTRTPDRYRSAVQSVTRSQVAPTGAMSSDHGPTDALGSMPSEAWAAVRAELVGRFPDVAWRGWTRTHDASAEQQLMRHGADRLLRVASRPTLPDLAVAWLRRWEQEPAPPPPRSTYRCLDHEVTHHGTCPGCRADQLATR